MKLINDHLIEINDKNISIILVKDEKRNINIEVRIKNQSDHYKHLTTISKWEFVQFMKLIYSDLS